MKAFKQWLCGMFHTMYANPENENEWYCPKCNTTKLKSHWDNFTGPK